MNDGAALSTTVIPVVFCLDANYARYAAVATYSLCKHTRTPLKIYWICPSTDLQVISVVCQQLRTNNIEVVCVGTNADIFQDWKVMEHINSSSYIRLLIPTLIKEEKVIYLDSDTLVLDDLLPLYQTDLKDCSIAGVIDPGGHDSSRIPRDANDRYINSGVLLMHLERLRKDDFLKQCTHLYSVYHKEVVWSDQCLINKFAENKKIILDPKWNRQIFSHALDQAAWQIAAAPGHSKVIHFLGRIKPWQKWCVSPVADFWWAYANELALPHFHRSHLTWFDRGFRLAKRCTPRLVKTIARRLIK
jgi:lipopolysaccharide biosynthesis glycosyltransferase